MLGMNAAGSAQQKPGERPIRCTGRDDHGGCQLLEFIADQRDERLEQQPAKVEPASHRVDLADAGQPPGVPGDVDDARVPAAGENDEAFSRHMDHHGLVVEDEGIRFPRSRPIGLVHREPRLET